MNGSRYGPDEAPYVQVLKVRMWFQKKSCIKFYKTLKSIERLEYTKWTRCFSNNLYSRVPLLLFWHKAMLLELWITQLFPISSLCNLILCTCRAQFIHMSSAEHYSLISLYFFLSLSLHRLLILTALKLKFFTCIISHLKIQGSTPVWQAILLGSRTTQPGWQFYQVRCIMTETGAKHFIVSIPACKQERGWLGSRDLGYIPFWTSLKHWYTAPKVDKDGARYWNSKPRIPWTQQNGLF